MKIFTIKTSAEFKKISQTQQKFFSKSVILLTSKSLFLDKRNSTEKFIFCRVGYTVAKTVSKLSVQRNLAKRRLREAFRKLAVNHAKAGFDYVIIARKEILDNDFDKIFSDLKFCLTRIHNSAPQQKNSHKSFPKKTSSANETANQKPQK